MKCPYCDAEVGRNDLFCGTCGKRLPTAPREGRNIALIIGVVAAVVVGCTVLGVVMVVFTGGVLPLLYQPSPTPTLSPPVLTPTRSITTPLPPTSTPVPPTPTPEVIETTYTNASLGFSIWYPEDWVYEEQAEQVVFASSQEVITADQIETGAGMMVTAQDLEGETVEDVIEMMVSFPVAAGEMEISDPQPRAIGGGDGTIVTFEGAPEGSEVAVRGFVAGVGYDGWAYLFAAVSVLEDWPEYGPGLEAMLDSVQLSGPGASPVAPTAPAPRTPTPLAPSPIAGADAYEPDDDIAQAKPITTDGTHQTHNFHQEEDVDYVSFAAQEGTQYTIETGDLGSLCDTILTLYDHEATQLSSDDDGAEEPLASLMTWTAPDSGTYYVKIDNYGGTTGAGTEYDVWIVVGGPTPTPTVVPIGADAYEPDDSIAQANPITRDSTPQAHSLHVVGDHDYVSFVAEAGIGYRIETLQLGSNIDTIIYLYDSEENELASNDDAGGESWASRIIWVAPSSGTYYVMIRDLGEDSAGADATYGIRVMTEGVIEGDQYEPDDSITQAKPIDTDGTRQAHTFHTSNEVDYVFFAAAEGVEYTIETGNLEGGCDTTIYLYDADGYELDYNDDTGEGYASRVVWTFSSSGNYYVKIEEYRGRAGPDVSYQIWVSR